MSNELVVIPQTPQIPDKWSYDESVAGIKNVILNWKNLTVDLATNLWIAREMLRKTAKTQPRSTEGIFIPTGKNWSSYCQEIGSDRHTINNWLKRFFPELAPPKKSKTPKTDEEEFCEDCEMDSGLIAPRNVEAQCLLCGNKYCGGHITKHLSDIHGVDTTLNNKVIVDKTTGEIL